MDKDGITEDEKEQAKAIAAVAKELVRIADGNLFTVNKHFPTGFDAFAFGSLFTSGVIFTISVALAFGRLFSWLF